DLQIRSKFISRHHAQIISTRARSVLEDLNSTNGVFVRSKRVKRHELADGDVIQIGEHKLVYRELRDAYPAERFRDEADDEDELDERLGADEDDDDEEREDLEDDERDEEELDDEDDADDDDDES